MTILLASLAGRQILPVTGMGLVSFRTASPRKADVTKGRVSAIFTKEPTKKPHGGSD